MSRVVKIYVPIILLSCLGTLMAASFFLDVEIIGNAAAEMQIWTVIVASIALGLAAFNLSRQHVSRMLKGNIYSIALLVSLVSLPILYFITGSTISPQYVWLYNNFIGTMYPAMYSLVGYAIASCCFRSFRVRNIESFLVLITAAILLLGKVPVGASLTPLTNWLMNVLNTGGYRGVTLGVGIGIFSYSLRVLFGIERTWLSQLKEE